jgi:acyl-[acyl-carrier-protein]-phospholipid O-acyltransferase/long-chain-fatty-acid--[acyl-carrier-protein] ligase
MTATQFFGAFNDNLFKQLVLLICIDHERQFGTDHQSTAMALFAIPFVLFSGFGGYLADRTSKRRIVVLCKVAEIAVMFCGLMAIFSGSFAALFVVLLAMSTQSAFFGPSKYGILPELFRERDLPQVNGVIQMTTFVAIIFGMALAGYAKDWFQEQLWIVSGLCVGIAVIGTATSLPIRKTPVARPGLPFTPSALGINRDTWNLLRGDRQLLGVLLVSSLFWFVGGALQPTVNAFGRIQLQYSDSRTSHLAACMGIGIAAGCLLAGKISQRRVNFRLVTVGAWGIVASLIALSALGLVAGDQPNGMQTSLPEPFLELFMPASTVEFLARLGLTALGAFAGLFVVPLQVFLQTRPPEEQKGRMIGAMNLINWIGIVLAALFFFGCRRAFDETFLDLPVSWIFGVLAMFFLPIAILYRPSRSAAQHETA